MANVIGTLVTDPLLLNHLDLPEDLELRVDFTVNRVPVYRLYKGDECVLEHQLVVSAQLAHVVNMFLGESSVGDGLVVDTTVPENFGTKDIAPDDETADEFAGTGDMNPHSTSHWQNASEKDTLESIKSSKNMDNLETALNDSRPEVREMAKERLQELEDAS